MKKIILGLFITFLVSACGTAPTPAPSQTAPETLPREPQIDYIGLQQTLGLERADQKLGYIEKSFDTCTAGHGFSHSENCHKEFFVLMHFQLKCRETDEAPPEGVSAMDTHPIGNHPIRWALDNKQGIVQTDSDGYGQIRTSYVKRPGSKHIKLSSDTHFLYVKAKDLDRIVTPPIWCN